MMYLDRWNSCRVLLLAALVTCAAGQKAAHIAPSGETAVDLISNAAKLHMVISTHEEPNGTPSKPVAPKHSPCTMSRFPCSVVDAIAISVNGNKVFVPLSVLCDLADVNTAEIRAVANGWVATLDGGDASESYRVGIEFDASRISRRTLTDGESGQKLQETRYYEVVD